MSDNEELERTRDFVRSKRRPVRRTAGPRSGSVITSSPATRRGHIRGRSHDSLYHVLETMTRMHWLHSHTGGAYKRAVDERVESYREWEGHTYPGIYRDMVGEVQHMDRFRNLPARLPWLPQYASSGAALDAAVAAARSS
jgi:hypothetical protein